MTGEAFDRVLGAVEAAGCRVQRTGRGARAQCPAHGSRGLSLSIRDLDGRAAVTCFAGCEDTEVLAEVGLAVRDLFDTPRAEGYRPTPPRRMTPWDQMMRDLGLTSWPPLEHVLRRMQVEAAKEAGHTDLPAAERAGGGRRG